MGRGREPVVSMLAAGAAAICLLACSAGLSAQEARTEGRIHVDVVVTDAAGWPVSGLSNRDFRLLDDGNERSLSSFAAYDGVGAKADPPVQMIFVVDCVNNRDVELGYIREGLAKFLRLDHGHLAQPTTIVQFTPSEVRFLSRMSADGNALAEEVEQIDVATKPEESDAFALSLNALSTVVNQTANEPGRKMVIWLGPGWPIGVSGPHVVTSIDERGRRADYQLMMHLAKGMEEGRMALYGGYKGADYYKRNDLKPVRKVSEADPGDLALEVLAVKSGGHGEPPEVNRGSAVMGALNNLVAEARTFYSLTFDPPRAKGRDDFHELKVKLDKRGLKVHAITGYYDEPEYFRPELEKKTVIVQRPAVAGSGVWRRASVAQLTEIVEEVKRLRDERSAKEIEHVRLTERLSSPKLAALSAQLMGPKSKSALMAVGDASVFLEPPKDEIPEKSAPSLAEQKQIMSRAVEYLEKINPKLPDFYAKRLTTSFEEVWTPKEGTSAQSLGALWPAGEFKATVYYRGGKEVIQPEGPAEIDLITQGTFGPILNTVVVDAAHSMTKWSRWEAGPNGLMAVFRFRVPQMESHYQVSFPTFAAADDLGLTAPSAYHGEIGIDPESGTILRLVLEADPDSGSSGQRADIMVEYGSVVIGERLYTCPVRSVSIATGRSDIRNVRAEVTRLDDVVFGSYHIFRSSYRIVP